MNDYTIHLEKNIYLCENNYKYIWCRTKICMAVKIKIKTGFHKGATHPVRRQTHPKPLQCKSIIVMMNTLKRFKVRADRTNKEVCWIWVREGFIREVTFEWKFKE